MKVQKKVVRDPRVDRLAITMLLRRCNDIEVEFENTVLEIEHRSQRWRI